MASIISILLQMRSNAKAVLDADAKALQGVISAAEKAITPLATVTTNVGAAGKAAATAGLSLNDLVESYKALGQEPPAAIKKLVDAQNALGRGTDDLGTKTDDLGKKSKSAASSQGLLTGTIAKYLTTAAVLGAIRSTTAYADELTSLSHQTHISVTALQELGYAARQNGDELSDVTGVIGVMADRLGSGDTSAKQAIKDLGLEFERIRTMSPDQAFITLATAVSGVSDPMEQARLKTDLFGRAALNIPTITSDLKTLAQQAHDTGQVLGQDAVRGAAAFDQALTDLMTQGKVLLGTVLVPLMDIVQNMPGAFDRLTGSTERSGTSMETFIKGVFSLYGLKASGFIVDELARKIDVLPDVAASGFGRVNAAIMPVSASIEELDAITNSLDNRLAAHNRTVDEAAAAAKRTAAEIAKQTIVITGNGVGWQQIELLIHNYFRTADALNQNVLPKMYANLEAQNIALSAGIPLLYGHAAATRAIGIEAGETADWLNTWIGGLQQLPQEASVATSAVAKRIAGVLSGLGGNFQGWAAEVIEGTISLKKGFEGLWGDIKTSFADTLSSMLTSFTQTFLKGLLNSITGAQGGFAGAFTGMLGGGGSGGGLLGGLLGGGGALAGGALAAGSLIPGAAIGATGAFTGGAISAGGGAMGLGGLALSGAATAGIGLAIAGAVYLGMKLLKPSEESLKVNPQRDKDLAGWGGYVGLSDKLNAATGSDAETERLRSALFRADSAKKYDAAVKAINATLDAYKLKQDEGAVASKIAANEAMKAHEATLAQASAAVAVAESSVAAIEGTLKGLADQQAALQQQVADEAPEEVIGVIEQMARDQMAILAEQQAVVQTQLEGAQLNLQKAVADEAAIAEAGVAHVETAVTGIAAELQVNTNAWRTWRDAVVGYAGDALHAVNAVTWGSSPGGIQEWRPMLEDAAHAYEDFSATAQHETAQVGALLRSVGLNDDSPADRRRLGLPPLGGSSGDYRPSSGGYASSSDASGRDVTVNLSVTVNVGGEATLSSPVSIAAMIREGIATVSRDGTLKRMLRNALGFPALGTA